MNAGLIRLWNANVKPSDTIYHLGDFGFPAMRVEGHIGPSDWELYEIFKQLNGHKRLVVGNHDMKNRQVLKLPWESMDQLLVVKENGVRAVLCHYPLETWASAHRGYLMLHGHSHGSLKRVIPHRFDVGVDVFKSGPIALKDLAITASEQGYEPQDHHGEDM
jgi:calcineurin-like phosphoesterase family protein